MTSVTDCSCTTHVFVFFLRANPLCKLQVFFGGIFTTTGLNMLCSLIILDVIFMMTLTGPEKDFNILGGGINQSGPKVPKRNLNFGKLISCGSKILRIFAPWLSDPHVPCSSCPIGALMPPLSLPYLNTPERT